MFLFGLLLPLGRLCRAVLSLAFFKDSTKELWTKSVNMQLKSGAWVTPERDGRLKPTLGPGLEKKRSVQTLWFFLNLGMKEKSANAQFKGCFSDGEKRFSMSKKKKSSKSLKTNIDRPSESTRRSESGSKVCTAWKMIMFHTKYRCGVQRPSC